MPDDARSREELQQSIEAASVAITVRSIPMVIESLLTTELTVQQIKALSTIVLTPEGATGAGLAETFGVSMASTSKLVDRLVDRGFVERSTDTADQRVRRIHATRLGTEAFRELLLARPELSAEVLDRLGIDDLRALDQGLRAVSEELRRLKG